jgi:Domain of unknown function (DUF4328)/Protein of unknown function (DUF2510)
MTQGVPPGWYIDPTAPQLLRWWDGSTWTPYTFPAVDYEWTREWARRAFRSEHAMVPWAKVVAVVYPLVGVASALTVLATSTGWANYFHSIRGAFDAASQGIQAPPVANPPMWSEIFVPIAIAAEVLFLVWQYRAATTARRFGYRARRSPGWGVASYFIPVVQLWFPYQALRDCLPPHDDRGVVARVWALLIVTSVLNGALAYLLVEVRATGIGLLVVSVVLEGLLALSGYQMIQQITDAHHRDTA